MKKITLGQLRIFLFALLIATGSVAAQTKPVFQGQGPTPVDVDTTDKPIQKQERKVFEFPEDGIHFSNKFPSARLNLVTRTGENQYTVLITPENEPINPSPWYAFKVWSDKKRDITIKMTYPEWSQSRYYPKISKDGKNWKALDMKYITEEEKGTDNFGPGSLPKRISMKISVDKSPLWVSAQEIEDSARVYAWMDKLAKKSYVDTWEFAKSKEGRPMRMMRIGKADSKRMIMVISRQHPPEVTGYFAMQAFIEKIADGSKLSKQFRENYTIYVVPLMNPDGVDEGHWRHNAGGIDLNRDWEKFNQPEDKNISNFLKEREQTTGGKFYFGIDFHSTWDDIYYPAPAGLQSNMTGLVYDWLDAIKKAMPGYTPNVRPSERITPAVVSRGYFYVGHAMEGIIFEIGDNTSREFIKKKGEVGAEELMKLMNARANEQPVGAARANGQ